MSYETYEEFDDQMSDILSSGSCFEMSNFHRTEIKELLSGMDRDCVINDLNTWYGKQEPEELREGELSYIGEELLEGIVSVKIVFE